MQTFLIALFTNLSNLFRGIYFSLGRYLKRGTGAGIRYRS